MKKMREFTEVLCAGIMKKNERIYGSSMYRYYEKK
jgi:hypothetical protein